MNVRKITQDIFKKLDTNNFEYCVYNGYENLPYRIDSDLDLAVDNISLNHLDNILYEITKRNGVFLLSKIWHDSSKIAYIISPYKLIMPNRLQIDFFNEFSMKDFYDNNSLSRYCFMDQNTLLINNKPFKYFKTAPPEQEFIFKLIRRIIKEDINNENFKDIRNLYLNSIKKSDLELTRYFPSDTAKNISYLINTNDLQSVMQVQSNLRKKLNRFKKDLFHLAFPAITLKRLIYRVTHPVGFSVALLGPDGCGKTGLAKELMRVLTGCFHGQKLFYWRPEFFKQPGIALKLREELKTGINPDPHGHIVENPLKSLFRFCYYLLDFTLGYFLKVVPLKIKKYICIFDRYYYDVLIDSFRYNFSLPKWLLKLPTKFIPRLEAIIVLDVSVDKLLKRKKELSQAELERQRKMFLNLVKMVPNTYIVDNSKPKNKVVEELTSMILLNRSYQTYLSLNIKPYEDEKYFQNLKKLLNLNKKDNHQLIAFPNLSNPRVYLAIDTLKQFKSSLKLYSPSRPFIKFIYNNFPAWLIYHGLMGRSENKYSLGKSLLCEKIKKIFPYCRAISIYTGAPGPHRKPLLQVMDCNGAVIGYVKIGFNCETNKLLVKEYESINLIKSMKLKSAQVPDIIAKGELNENLSYLALKAISTSIKRCYKITNAHIEYMNEIFIKTGKAEVFGKSKLFVLLKERLNLLKNIIPYYWILRYRRILEFYDDKKIEICLSHGDFTTWNTFITNDQQLILFDWEYSRENIMLSDLFHFIIQSKVFSRQKPISPKKVILDLKDKINYPKNGVINLKLDNWENMLLIYLFEISSFYFERNYKSNFVEKDLRLEITWSKMIDYLLNNKVNVFNC